MFPCILFFILPLDIKKWSILCNDLFLDYSILQYERKVLSFVHDIVIMIIFDTFLLGNLKMICPLLPNTTTVFIILPIIAIRKLSSMIIVFDCCGTPFFNVGHLIKIFSLRLSNVQTICSYKS